MSDDNSQLNTDGLDLLWGAGAIADAIGKTKRSTFHLLEKGNLPARKIGNQWVISRKALAAHFEAASV